MIQAATWQSLREIQVPTDVVPVLRPAQFTHLRQLTLVIGTGPRDIHSGPFLEDLQASRSLRIFMIDKTAYEALGWQKERLGAYLPLNCRRANLAGPYSSLDAILSLVTRSQSGHRISELGMSSFLRGRVDDSGQTFLVAARALLESVEIELIWRDEHYCQSELTSFSCIVISAHTSLTCFAPS